MTDRLLTVPQAAERLGLSRSSFYRLLHADEGFPAIIRLGGAARVSENAIDAYIARLVRGSDGTD